MKLDLSRSRAEVAEQIRLQLLPPTVEGEVLRISNGPTELYRFIAAARTWLETDSVADFFSAYPAPSAGQLRTVLEWQYQEPKT